MRNRLNEAVARWLGAEGGRGDAADAALRRVFEAWPLPSPSPGFVARVMAGAGLVPAPRPLPLGWRVGLGLAMALAGAAAVVSPAVLAGLARLVSPADVAGLAAGTLVEVCQRLGEGLALWQALATLGRTVTEALSTPPVLAALLAASLMSAGGLRVLLSLSAVSRRSGDARI